MGEAAELPGGLEGLCRGVGDVDGNGILDKRVEPVVAIRAGVDHGFAPDRPDGAGEYGGRVVVGEIAAYHFNIIGDEGGLREDLTVELLEDKGVAPAADEPGAVDQSATVWGNGDIGGEAIGGQDLVVHV